MKAMRPVRSWGFLPVLAVAAAAFLSAPGHAQAPPAAEGPFDLTLFYTNDIHGAFAARPHEGQDGPLVGGFAALSGHLARESATAVRSVLLDGGDFMTGNPVCELVVDGVRGGALAALMGAVGYAATVVGNHEFDIGRADLVALVGAFPLPVLGADLHDHADRGDPALVPGQPDPLVIERDGLRIGVIGVSHRGLEGLLTPLRLDGVTSRDQEGVIRRQLADLVARTDVQVLLSHNGVDTDRRLARALAADGLDVIVGGHSHTRLEEPAVEDGVLIVQAGSSLRHLGRLDLRLDDGRVTGHRGRLILLTADAEDEADPHVRALVDHFDQQVAAVYGRQIGRLADDLRRNSRHESALGSWLCDVVLHHSGADVALINSGGIRKHLLRGPLTKLDIHEVLPFGNTVVVHRMPGASLRRIAQANARAAEVRSYGILQVSGLEYWYRSEADGEVVLESVLVGGEPLVDERIYEVAMPDFVSGMGDVYLAGADLGPMRETGENLADIVIDHVERTGGLVEPPQAGRFGRR